MTTPLHRGENTEISWVETMSPQDGSAALNQTEQAAMDALLQAYNLILDWGLRANSGELTSAVHVIQGFITQHMLQRISPEQWGKWFTAEAQAERRA